MAIEGSSFELGVVSDPRAIRQFLSELEVVPAALKRISAAINQVDLGDGRKFAGDGRQLAEAFINAARAELAGGSFQRAFREAMSGVDLRIPAEAQTHLRSDLERINAEIKRLLPQQVQIGIRANTNPEDFRRQVQQQVPAAFGGPQPQQGMSLAEMRAQARQLREAAARPPSSGSPFGVEPGSVRDLQPTGPSEPLTPLRRFVANQPQRDQTQGRLEEQAYREDDRREQQRITHAQQLGRLEERAYNEDARRAERNDTAVQRAGTLEERAYREDERRQQQHMTSAQRAGKLEEEAYKEDARRTALSTPDTEDATLARATELARQRRLQTQRYFDDNPDDQRLVEQARLRSLGRDAQREQLRQGGATDQIKAGLLGFGSGTFLERQASIVSTTASFAAGGMAFQAVMNGLTEVVSGTRQFEEALANLSVTFNDSTNNLRGFATEVGAEANAVGLTQAQGVEAASKSVGLFNTGGLSEQDKEDFAKLAVGVTGRIAQQGGTDDLSGVETNLAGILRSFQLQNSDLTRVEDSIAVIAKQTGGNQAEILQAASETATLARSAGFDAFQNSAIIANQATTTGQSAGAAAEQLAQVFAQATNTAVQAKFNQLGIDTNQPLSAQLDQLSGKVKSGQVSQDEFGAISALFGRSRSGAAFRNLVEGLPHINQLADQARNSPGEGQRQFEQIFGSISGEITKTVGALRNLATELAQSGALDILAAIIVAVHQTANALTEVLHLFNEIPRPLRSVAFAILELATAAKLFGGSAAVGKVLSFLGGGTAVGQKVIGTVAGEGVAASVASRTGAGAAGAASLGVLTSPAAIVAIGAVATLIAAQKFVSADATAARAETKGATDSANATTADQLRGAASSRRQAAQAEQGRRDAVLGLGNVVDFVSGSHAAQSAAHDRELADALDARAKTVGTASQQADSANAAIFGRFNSADEVTAQLQRLQAEGLTAAQRVQALSSAFDQISRTANTAGVAVIRVGSSQLFGQNVAAGLTGAVGEGASQADLRGQSTDIANTGNVITDTFAGLGGLLVKPFGGADGIDTGKSDQFYDLRNKLQNVDTAKLQGDVSTRIQGVLTSRGIDTSKGDAVLSQDDIGAIESAANDQLEQFIGSVIPKGSQYDEIRQTIRNSFHVNLGKTIKAISGNDLSPDQAVNYFQSVQGEADNAFNQDSFRDKAGASAQRVKTLRGALQKAKQAVGTVDTSDQAGRQEHAQLMQRLQDAQTAVDQAEADDAKIQLERTQALSRLRQSRRGALDNQGRLQDQIDAAKTAVSSATDPTDRANAQAQLNDLKNQKEQYALDTATSVAKSKIDPRDTAALAKAAVNGARKHLTYAKANGDAKAIADATTALQEANINELQTNVGIANARRTAQTPLGDTVAAANTALTNAKADLGTTKKGTQAYYEALVQVAEARGAVTNALLDRQAREATLAIDITDPVALAKAALQDAQRRLRAAKGKDDREKAQGAVRQAEVNQEAAAFQQRLSDVQTADQLGRISHQQYLAYLQSEHDRLSSIAKRTRQQQDELNQIDVLMKSAADQMSGQFNLGDIKLPTVYEVRRAIKAGTSGIQAANNDFGGASAGQVVTDNSQRTLIVQGVSVEEVMRRVTALYGGKQVATSGGRKR